MSEEPRNKALFISMGQFFKWSNSNTERGDDFESGFATTLLWDLRQGPFFHSASIFFEYYMSGTALCGYTMENRSIIPTIWSI